MNAYLILSLCVLILSLVCIFISFLTVFYTFNETVFKKEKEDKKPLRIVREEDDNKRALSLEKQRLELQNFINYSGDIMPEINEE